ncbi:MAG TPA: hypothetical protein VEK08_04670 [Planctomycetota bacterium]|nr:hypothetical protein [Planctomycetota bacterium]
MVAFSCRIQHVRFAFALCAGLFASLAFCADDKVTLFKGNEVRVGRVKKADIEEIHLEIKDARTQAVNQLNMKGSEVASIEWDVNDPEFRSGVANYEGRHYAEAVRNFSSIISDPDELNKIRAEVRPALFYFYAESLYRSGKPADAVPIFEKLMNEFKTSYYVPLAVGSLVDAAIQTKDFAKVPALLAQLRTLGAEQKALGDYYEGQMLLAQGKTKPAEEKFNQAAAGSNVPGTKGMALMGQARCAIAENNLAKGRDLAQRALSAGAPTNVAGAAHLVIGEATLGEIETQKPTGEALEKRLMDALLSFMRVQEQYRGDVDSEAQAILRAGDCLVKLSKLKDRGGDIHRGIYMYTKLTTDTRYRATRFRAMAEEALKNASKR